MGGLLVRLLVNPRDDVAANVGVAYHFPKALERLEELKRGGKGNKPANGRLTRKDQRRDEAECAVM